MRIGLLLRPLGVGSQSAEVIHLSAQPAPETLKTPGPRGGSWVPKSIFDCPIPQKPYKSWRYQNLLNFNEFWCPTLKSLFGTNPPWTWFLLWLRFSCEVGKEQLPSVPCFVASLGRGMVSSGHPNFHFVGKLLHCCSGSAPHGNFPAKGGEGR